MTNRINYIKIMLCIKYSLYSFIEIVIYIYIYTYIYIYILYLYVINITTRASNIEH